MSLQPLAPYLSIAEIILAVVLTVLVLLQSKGSDLGGFMGGGGDTGGGYRTKRGVEATLHRVTIYFSIAFFVLTLLTFIAWGQAA
jgi:preprotein translocase subunit SecG